MTASPTGMVSGFWAGVSLAIIAVILGIWATSLVVAAYRSHGDPTRPRWHPRRWYPACFQFWLGWTFVGLGVLLGYIGFVLLLRGNDSPLWGVAVCVATGFAMVQSFKHWAVERLPEEGL